MSKESEETQPEDWRLYAQPITNAIPYFYRWKINQIKLMRADLQTLYEKYGIAEAKILMVEVDEEIARLCAQLAESIHRKQGLRKKYEGEKKTVP